MIWFWHFDFINDRKGSPRPQTSALGGAQYSFDSMVCCARVKIYCSVDLLTDWRKGVRGILPFWQGGSGSISTAQGP